MPRANVLLIMTNGGQARSIAQAMLMRSLPAPELVDSVDAALLWLADRDCDAIVLSNKIKGHDVPGALARLRQRRADVPIVVVSDANAEQVAVAAFRLGVSDYVPVHRGYESYVAERLQQLIQPRATEPAPVQFEALATELALPPALLQPSYQNRLRLVGRELDRSDGRGATVLEVPGGLLVRTVGSGRHGETVLEFANRDFLQLTREAYGARETRGSKSRYVSDVLPTGYEDFLRALGHWLDSRGSSSVQVVELDDLVVVTGLAAEGGDYRVHLRAFQVLLGPEDVKYLLDEAFRRRSTPERGKPFARLVGRKLA